MGPFAADVITSPMGQDVHMGTEDDPQVAPDMGAAGLVHGQRDASAPPPQAQQVAVKRNRDQEKEEQPSEVRMDPSQPQVTPCELENRGIPPQPARPPTGLGG